MPLKAVEIQAFRPIDTPYKKTDEKGLYLLVRPQGSKHWYWKYQYAGKEKKMALGQWPEVSLAMARRARDVGRFKLADGIDPMAERKKEKAAIRFGGDNSFASVAREYIEHKMVGEERAEATLKKARWFLELLTPAIGNMPIDNVDPQMILAPLKKLEARGNRETAKKCRSFASRVFRYGAATGRCKVDPSAILQGALISPKARHYAAILEPAKLGQLLRAIDQFDGGSTTKLALQITPHVYVRPGELRHAEWDEFDWEKAQWTIPAGKMKARRKHVVPLSWQVVELLQQLKARYDGKGYVFPASYTWKRPMSENTVNFAFRRMGFERDEVTAHGFRSRGRRV